MNKINTQRTLIYLYENKLIYKRNANLRENEIKKIISQLERYDTFISTQRSHIIIDI